MKTIKNAVFVKSASSATEYKGFGKPEIVLVGRSNVGKSSLLNMLATNSKLAKVSSTQGKTRLLNFFLFNDEFMLVDLPGYGYAATSKVEQLKWKNMIEGYIKKSKNIASAILILDIRHLPTVQDIQMFEFLTFYNISVTIVATKYDKIKKSECAKKMRDIAATLKVGVENIMLVSSETAHGRQNLIDRIYQFVGESV